MADIHTAATENPHIVWLCSCPGAHHFGILLHPHPVQDMTLLTLFPSKHSSYILLLQPDAQALE